MEYNEVSYMHLTHVVVHNKAMGLKEYCPSCTCNKNEPI